MLRSNSQSCFCAFCKVERRVYQQRHLNAINVAFCFLMSGILMYAIWGTADPRGLVIFVTSMMLTEIFIQVRWRLAITCSNCGFDPILYIKDKERACNKVKSFVDHKSKQIDSVLRDDPLKKIKNNPRPSKKKPNKGRRISRQA